MRIEQTVYRTLTEYKNEHSLKTPSDAVKHLLQSKQRIENVNKLATMINYAYTGEKMPKDWEGYMTQGAAIAKRK